MATVHLNVAEEKFWKMRPRKYIALIGAFTYFKSGGESDGSETTTSVANTKGRAPTGFIDQVLF